MRRVAEPGVIQWVARRFAPVLAVHLAALACGPGPRVPAPAARPAYSSAELAEVVSVAEVAVAPDGSEISFTSDRSGAYELWTVSLGDTGAIPRQRTRAREFVSGIVYSPDGSLLIFEMDSGGDERTDLWMLRRGAGEPERLTDTPTAENSVRFSPDGSRIAFASDPDREFRFDVHAMDLGSGAVARLTRGEINVLDPVWSADGRTIVAVRTPDDQVGEIVVIDSAAGAERSLAPPLDGGIAWPIDFLPDGRLLATATNDAGFLQIALVDVASGRVEYAGSAEWDVEHAVAADDGAVVFSRNVRGESEVAIAAAGGLGAPRVLLRGGVVEDMAVDRAGTVVAVARETSRGPTEVLAIDAATGAARVVVPATLGAVDVSLLAEAALREFYGFDGTGIDAFVWAPPVERLGAPPPAVVHVHGGPNSQTRGRFYPQIQALAEAGFLVLSVNYRGSTGYGRAFEDLNNRDWGGGDLRDIIAVVDALAAAGEIDPSRVGIMGASYGGYMTLRAVTAAPDVWSAAVDMYGMPDLLEDYRMTEDRFGTWYLTEMGDPAQHEDLYRDRSPIHALDRVRAPLLVFQGENDTNVPRAQSDAAVAALRERGLAVEYVVYPDEGHGFTRRENRLDCMARTVEFLLRHLGGRR